MKRPTSRVAAPRPPAKPSVTSSVTPSVTRELPPLSGAGERASKQKAARVRPPRPESEAAQARREMRAAIAARRTAERNEIRRFTAHVRRRRQAALAIVASVAGLAVFVAVGTFSPVLALRTVTVQGTQRVDPALIAEGLAPQLGKPLPLVDANAIRDVIALQPLVKSFAVEAKPPHELVIHITERVAAGYLGGASGFTLVDPAGVTIEKSRERTVPLPLIDVKGASPTARGFPAAMAVLSALPDAVRSQVDRVAATTTDDVTLFLNPTGSRVFWGGPENAALKARVLSGLIANYPLGSVTTYDVSAPNSPVVS